MTIPFKISDGNIKGVIVDGHQYLSQRDILAWLYQNAEDNKPLDSVFLAMAKGISTMTDTKPHTLKG